MIETRVLNCIENYTGIPAYMEMPEKPPEAFAIVERIGGTLNEHIYHSIIAVKTYAPFLCDAAHNSELIQQALIYQMINEDDVIQVILNSSSNNTDQFTKSPRYQALFEIVHY